MSKYCPKCKHNFSDSFEECIYCGSELRKGIIEIEDNSTKKEVYEMTDVEILEKYSDYKQRIEKQTGHKMTDAEFLCGIRAARQDSLNLKSERYIRNNTDTKKHIPKCPTCGSENIKKISDISKAGSVALWGLFSRKVYMQWHCNNCGSEW